MSGVSDAHSPDSRLLSASPGTTVATDEEAGGGLRRCEDAAVSAPLLPAPLFRNDSEMPAERHSLISVRRNLPHW
jgi:hypothetical protein